MAPEKLHDIVDLQVNHWGKDFPHIKNMRDEIIEMLKVEQEKFEDTLKRGEGMVKRIAAELKAKNVNNISSEKLSELYDSHGLPPEIVKQAAEAEGVKVEVPEDFYALVAKRHMIANKPVEEESAVEQTLEKAIEGLPATDMLYYSEPYTREWDAKILKIINKQYAVLDRTCFYPEGGGQPADHGYFAYGGGVQAEVVAVQKIGKVILHKIKTENPLPKEGSSVRGILDWEHRYSLMKAHTGTHLVNGAARRVLGEHVWQSGTQKGIETTRLDISHYRRLTQEEVHRIERLANEAVLASMPVETAWLSRNEAEAKYGFRLYQGGAVPGKEIRVVKTGNWDVEACAGTHLKNTGEIGFVKIVNTERVQDGVERLVYSVGMQAVKAVQKQETLLHKVAETLNAPIEKLDKTVERIIKELKETNTEKKKLLKELTAKESGALTEKAEEAQEIGGAKLFKRDFKGETDVNRMVQTANEIIKRNEAAVTLFYAADEKTAKLLVMAGPGAVTKGVDAGQVVKESAPIFGGGGGGRPNFAQGGGTKPEKLADAVKTAEESIRKQLTH